MDARIVSEVLFKVVELNGIDDTDCGPTLCYDMLCCQVSNANVFGNNAYWYGGGVLDGWRLGELFCKNNLQGGGVGGLEREVNWERGDVCKMLCPFRRKAMFPERTDASMPTRTSDCGGRRYGEVGQVLKLIRRDRRERECRRGCRLWQGRAKLAECNCQIQQRTKRARQRCSGWKCVCSDFENFCW